MSATTPPTPLARLRRIGARGARALGLRRNAELQQRLRKVRTQRDTARARLKQATAARDAARARVADLTGQLDQARASAGTGTERTDLSYLFIVTYGRSGSTLLQGILSSIPGYLIRGENGGVLTDLFRFHDTVRHHRERLARPEPLGPEHPWWGIDGYPEATALARMRALMLDTVLRPEPGTRVIGFKEITWLPERAHDLLEFTQAVFPGARFILNTRDLSDVARSKWWARRPDAMEELMRIESSYAAAVDALGPHGFRVHYDDYVGDPGSLRGLFAWLGEPFDEQRVRNVMAVRHSY